MTESARRAAFTDLIRKYVHDPVSFARDICKFNPDESQAAVMMDVALAERVTVRSGQGVGKTALEAVIALWYMTTRPFARVVATAPTRQQLHDVLWAEIAASLHHSQVDENLRLHGRV